MDSTTVIVAIILVLALLVALLLGLVGLAMLVMFMRRRKPAPVAAKNPVQRSILPEDDDDRLLPQPAPALAAGGLNNIFEEEGETKTELFQRGQMALEWEDDEDEAEATEIFSAHGAAGDLAEFAFDDD